MPLYGTMSRFEIASECRKLRDEMIFYRYQGKAVFADFPEEVKLFYNNASLKIQKLSYISLNQLKQECLELLQKDIGSDRMSSIKVNSLIKFINSYRSDLDSSSIIHTNSICSEDNNDTLPVPVESCMDSRIPLYDNFTEPESDCIAGFCQEACRALLRNANKATSFVNDNTDLNTATKLKNQVMSSTIMNAIYAHGENMGDKLASKYSKIVDDFLYNYTASAISEESITAPIILSSNHNTTTTSNNKIKPLIKKQTTVMFPAATPRAYVPRMRDERGVFQSAASVINNNMNNNHSKNSTSSLTSSSTTTATTTTTTTATTTAIKGTKRTLSSMKAVQVDDKYMYDSVTNSIIDNDPVTDSDWSSLGMRNPSTTAPTHPVTVTQRPLQRTPQSQSHYAEYSKLQLQHDQYNTHPQQPHSHSQPYTQLQPNQQQRQNSIHQQQQLMLGISSTKRPYKKSNDISSSSSLTLRKPIINNNSTIMITASNITAALDDGFVVLPSKQNTQSASSSSSSSSSNSIPTCYISEPNPFQQLDIMNGHSHDGHITASAGTSTGEWSMTATTAATTASLTGGSVATANNSNNNINQGIAHPISYPMKSASSSSSSSTSGNHRYTTSSSSSSSSGVVASTPSVIFPRKMLNSYVPHSPMTSSLSHLRHINTNTSNNHNNSNSNNNSNNCNSNNSNIVGFRPNRNIHAYNNPIHNNPIHNNTNTNNHSHGSGTSGNYSNNRNNSNHNNSNNNCNNNSNHNNSNHNSNNNWNSTSTDSNGLRNSNHLYADDNYHSHNNHNNHNNSYNNNKSSDFYGQDVNTIKYNNTSHTPSSSSSSLPNSYHNDQLSEYNHQQYLRQQQSNQFVSHHTQSTQHGQSIYPHPHFPPPYATSSSSSYVNQSFAHTNQPPLQSTHPPYEQMSQSISQSIPTSETSSSIPLPIGVRLVSQGSYRAEVSVHGRQVLVGTFGTSALAGRAHDLALIRALGPTAACSSEHGLNMPIESYSTVSLRQFAVYDEVLKRQLFGSSWTGPKPCDFGFLILRK